MTAKTEAQFRAKYKAQNKRYLAYRREVRQTAAALYQVAGVLLFDANRIETDKAEQALDLLSWLAGNRGKKRPHDPMDLLPFGSSTPWSLVKAAFVMQGMMIRLWVTGRVTRISCGVHSLLAGFKEAPK